MRLLNYVLRPHSRGQLYSLTNGISFCWVEHVYTHSKKETQTHTRTDKCISMHTHTHRYIIHIQSNAARLHAERLKSFFPCENISYLGKNLGTKACTGQLVSTVNFSSSKYYVLPVHKAQISKKISKVINMKKKVNNYLLTV